ncbi:hypothetical protein [Chryseobacterium arthrosphaerae]|uniref:hypothetical protein n=1 Tax=Chryseobacterium arthrosphaerae TaxID=651561 RepID=UPI00241FD62E|nr:hypothetical protein [Chryseobacterium arthrosphaerae]
MKTHPVLFSTEMVQAILGNKKNQTRRTQGLENINKNPEEWILDGLRIDNKFIFHKKDKSVEYFLAPKFLVGDLLWVRETFCGIIQKDESVKYHYKASVSSQFYEAVKLFWKPSIHMPKKASRIFLEVINVKVERLQAISEEDAIAEGCSLYGLFGEYKGSLHPVGDGRYRSYKLASSAFKNVWESINGEQSWQSNPWVWVYEFKKIENPFNF